MLSSLDNKELTRNTVLDIYLAQKIFLIKNINTVRNNYFIYNGFNLINVHIRFSSLVSKFSIFNPLLVYKICFQKTVST